MTFADRYAVARREEPETWPEQIQALPRYHGMPVPFTVQWFGDVPDFRVMGQNSVRAVEERLCGVCGFALDYWIAFIGGPMSVQTRTYRDPAMHEECARFAARWCPFLAGVRSEMSERPAAGPTVTMPAVTSRVATIMLITRDYKAVVDARGGYIITPAKPKRLVALREQDDDA